RFTAGRFKDRRERALPILEPRPGEVTAVQVKQIEHHVHEPVGVRAGEEVLQGLEAGGALREEHRDLAIQDRALHGQTSRRLGDGGEVGRPVAAVPARRGGGAVVYPVENAVAVVLHLVQPLLAARGPVYQGGQLGRHELRQRGGTRARYLGRGRGRRGGGLPLARGRGGLAILSVRMPDAILGGRDLVERSPRGRALLRAVDDPRGRTGAGLGVAFLDEEPASPVVAPLSPADPYEGPRALQLVALEGELEIALPVSIVRITDRLPGATVPPQHRTAT